ncbi:hypothetical protein E9993_05010 [Labilibacter sediminis]|nr:hypothetical protein E9993_05010 [Labilibacter sediminis]
MIKWIIYIALIGILFSCRSKHMVQEIPVHQKPKTQPVFPIKEISHQLQNVLSTCKDTTLVNAYQQNTYHPFWTSDSVILQGIEWIKAVKYHGLNINEFNLAEILEVFNSTNTDSANYTAQYAKLDYLLTSTVKKCGYRIRYPSLNPRDFHHSWNFDTTADLPHDSVWTKLIKNKKTEHLNDFFEPKHKLYSKLKAELEKVYLNQTHDEIGQLQHPGFNLHFGDSNIHVARVKHKLLGPSSVNSDSLVYDRNLLEAVKTFQRKHGLVSDGIVGRQTYHFLNWKTEEYVDLLKINLERLRWYPDSALNNGFVINIPSQTLKVNIKDSCFFKSKVIVGKYKHKTPVFQSDVNYIVYNPCWTIPKSIAVTTILSGLRRDSNYLQKRHMFICKNGHEINPDSIDFNTYSKYNFPFQVFQRTCSQNALGKVKFMFDNKYNIYMHDTPQKSLFNKDIRNFSHGCIRVEHALELSKTLLYKVEQHNTPIQKYLSKGYPVKVYLENTIPINLVYLSCWEDYNTGEVVFCKDIYLNDAELLHKLNHK